jgi:UDP-hydrolysing UDP-N-acetyl-D-glucosamine 2-epimerase
MRHAISKLAHIHLAATEQSRKRLVRMGEPPDLVFNVGSPAVDGLSDIKAAGDGPELIVLLHPTGLEETTEQKQMMQLLKATARHARLVLEPNHDPGRDGIMRAIEQARAESTSHLPRDVFLSMLKGARAIVGNSSAGLIEAAVLRTPCVNLGNRQAGREKPGNVIDSGFGLRQIQQAVKAAIQLEPSHIRHPYGPGGTGRAIASLLAELDLAELPLHKRNSY